jgi:hypothetical protein
LQVFAKEVKDCANVGLDNLYSVLDLPESVGDGSVVEGSDDDALDSVPDSLSFCLRRPQRSGVVASGVSSSAIDAPRCSARLLNSAAGGKLLLSPRKRAYLPWQVPKKK